MDQDIFIIKLCSQDFNLSSEDTHSYIYCTCIHNYHVHAFLWDKAMQPPDCLSYMRQQSHLPVTVKVTHWEGCGLVKTMQASSAVLG